MLLLDFSSWCYSAMAVHSDDTQPLLSSSAPALAVYSHQDAEASLIRLRLLILLTDLEVAQLVRLLIRRHHPQPVTEVVLLQVLLGQVLQIPVGQQQSGSDLRCCSDCHLFIGVFFRFIQQMDRVGNMTLIYRPQWLEDSYTH